MIPADRVLLVSKGGRGVFNVRNDLRAYCEQAVEAGTGEFAQVLTEELRKTTTTTTKQNKNKNRQNNNNNNNKIYPVPYPVAFKN